MKYKLVASDMDGTLVNSKSELTERTKQAIIDAVNAGALFVTATGRPFCNIHIVNDLLDKDMPFIVFNGSAAYMGKTGECIFEKYLDSSLAAEAFQLGKEFGYPQIVWAGPQLFCSYICKETEYYRDFSTNPTMEAVGDIEELRGKVEGISKVLWIADPALIKERQPEMAAHFKERLNSYSSLPHFLEFVSIDASKGSALEVIGQRYGIDRSEMMAIGDAYNDESMLEYAGFSVAMGNAPDDIKAKCGYVTLSNDEDGVAEVIERFILN